MPQQYGFDSFTRTAVGSGWGTATDGKTWARTGVNATLSTNGTEGLIASTISAAATQMTLGATTLMDGEAIVRLSPGAATDSIAGLNLRFTDASNWYSARITPTSNNFKMVKNVAGTNTQLAAVAFTATVGTFYWLRFRVTGTILLAKVWQDGTAEPPGWTIQTSDASLAAGAGFGICGSAATATAIQCDSFFVTDYIDGEPYVLSTALAYQESYLPTEATTGVSVAVAGTDIAPLVDNLLTFNDSLLALPTFLDTVAGLASTSAAYQAATLPVEAGVAVVAAPLAGAQPTVVESGVATSALATVDSYGSVLAPPVSTSLFATDGYAQVEALAVSESLAAGYGYVVAEGQSLTETSFQVGSYAPTENIPVVEVFAAGNGGGVTEALTVSDTVMYSAITAPTELLTLVETLIQAGTWTLLDPLTLADALTAQRGLLALDAATLAEVVLWAEGLVAGESVLLLDASALSPDVYAFSPQELATLTSKLGFVAANPGPNLFTDNNVLSSLSNVMRSVIVVAVDPVTFRVRDGKIIARVR